MTRPAFLFIIFLLAANKLSLAQPFRTNTSNTNAWLMYFGNHRFSNNWGLHAEAQWRRHNLLADKQQLLLRTGIDNYLKNGSRITVGYAFINTYPYGDFAVANTFPEHRIWQQFFTAQQLGRVGLSHRYRLEQRWLGNAATGNFENGRYENRFRYMAKITVPLGQNGSPVFAAAYNELFVNFGKEVGYNLFDQNRLYAALGYVISPTIKLEVGYLYQVVQQRPLDFNGTIPRNRIEQNHTIQVGVFSNFRFYKEDDKE